MIATVAILTLTMATVNVHAQDASSSKDLKAAEQLYKSKCSLCHADDGSGSSITGKQLGAKNLKSDEIQKMSDDDLAAAISKGKGKMPAFGGKLNEAQIKSLVAEIRHLAGK
jgi:mono/diheme cytochrome c family protein